MHMTDALLTPAVGGALWAAAGGAVAWSCRRLRGDLDDRRVPLMGVLGAFVFAVQMVNFAIPGTGSSGHLGGGLLLAVLLGPHAALLVIASVLTVQALFFADGGLLALGCNIFNLGILPCFVAYPLVFRPVAGLRPGPRRLTAASLLAGVTGLQLGAVGVAAATTLSGIAALPVAAFLPVMTAIHLAIGLAEGLATAAVLAFLRQARPEVLDAAPSFRSRPRLKPVLAMVAVATLLVGGGLSRLASGNPDGLEWSIFRVAGETPAPPPTGLHGGLERIQAGLSLLPGYEFATSEKVGAEHPNAGDGATVSGMVGGLLTFALAGVLGFFLRRRPQAVRGKR